MRSKIKGSGTVLTVLLSTGALLAVVQAGGTVTTETLTDVVEEGGPAAKEELVLAFEDEGYTWRATSDASWLAADPARGTGSRTVTLSMDPSGLAPGVYSGSVEIKTNSTWKSKPSVVNVSVRLEVVARLHPPADLVAASASWDSASLAWADPNQGRTSVEIERAPGDSPGSWSVVRTAPPGTASATDTGLEAETGYLYRARAIDGDRASGYSNTAAVETQPMPLLAPADLVAANPTASSVDLSWIDPNGGRAGIEVERAVGEPEIWSLAQVLSAGAVSVTDAGLTPATTYWYRARAFDGSQFSPWSNLVSIETAPLAPPSAPIGTLPASVLHPDVDLVYLGAFRLPNEVSNGTQWAYGGHGMTFVPGGDPSGFADGHPGSLVSISHAYQNYVSEFDIVPPVVSPTRSVSDLNMARTLQPFVDITGGRQIQALTGRTLADVEYYPRQAGQTSDKFYWVCQQYYLPPHDEPYFGWADPDLSNLQTHGLWRLGGFPASSTSRYLMRIPPAWADRYTPGRLLAAGRHRVVNGGSWGPALHAFGPWNDAGGAPPPDGASLGATRLLYYPDEDHALADYSNADEWTDGVWLTAGDASAVVIVGAKALRTRANGLQYYGVPGPDGSGYKGYHGEPLVPMFLFYDPADLAAVVEGTRQSWEVQPYASAPVDDVLFKRGTRSDTILGGAAYDAENQLLYVLEINVDGAYDKRPIAHVWRVTDSGRSPGLTPPTSPGNLRAAAVTSSYVDLEWEPSTDDVEVVGYIVCRFGEPIATTIEPFWRDGKVNPDGIYDYSVVAWDRNSFRSAPVSVQSATPDDVDLRAPLIHSIAVDVAATSATVRWGTDERATARVEYRRSYSGDPFLAVEDLSLDRTHSLTIVGLTPGASYEVRISNTDEDGNLRQFSGFQGSSFVAE